jgi:hypothetical protein
MYFSDLFLPGILFSLVSVQQRQISSIKADKADAYKIQNVSAIDNTFGDILKMEVSPQIGKNAQQ